MLFVLFVCYDEISQTMRPPIAFLVTLESSWRGGVHGLGFVVFQLVVRKLWILKLFLFLKIKNTFTFILTMTTAQSTLVLGKERCTNFVLWCSNSQKKDIEFQKNYESKRYKITIISLYCDNITRHTSVSDMH